MITTPTTLILGAGASLAYGFPSGTDLVRRVVDNLQDRHAHIHQAMRECGFDAEKQRTFAEELDASRRYSIDRFLETRPDHLDIGKHAIAACLILDERDEKLRPGREEDWYRYLFDKMIQGTKDHFLDNMLTVITFNFDRSFERALFLALRASYGLSEADAARLALAVEPIHVHGQLAPAKFLGRNGRPYLPNVTASTIKAAAESIKIVQDEITEETKEAVRRALEGAHNVCFLGFGYHPENLRKLNVPSVLGNKRARGTVHNMASGEISAAVGRFNASGLDPVEGLDVMWFLRETDIIHQ